ncbi:MAG: HAMP domain-containing protein [Sutterella sp.]|nr:HAMP domain-containing protein [Sutterella sp.]
MLLKFIAWVRGSIARQFQLVFGTITLLMMLVALPAIVLTELSTGSGGAINVSGSMRMQSYKLALAVADPFSDFEARELKTTRACEEFGAKLVSRGLLNGIQQTEGDEAYRQYKALKARFENDIRPLAEASIRNFEARRRIVTEIPSFVEDVDRFVQTLETGLNERLALLKWLLAVILSGALGVSWLMLRVMKKSIFEPISEIGSAANAVRRGDFSVRARVGVPNEIGRLSSAFNYMVDELGRLYGNLEAEVARKTRDLNRRNEGLQLLSRVGQSVRYGERFEAEGLSAILDEACRLMEAEGACVRVGAGESSYVLAKSSGWDAMDRVVIQTVALSETTPQAGMLELGFHAESLEKWQTDLSLALAQSVGRSIERVTRQLDDRRLAVLEERSTIARELHDSIAQSLSFSRIQMHRLKIFVERNEPRDKVLSTVNELSQGISTAYSQLREVLTAFRLQISSAGLNGAIEETTDEFRNRTGLPVTVRNTLVGIELSPNEQVHVIHILREALINVEKHARATEILVTMSRRESGAVVLTVEDNGVGIPEQAGRYRHFGLTIMRERAEALGGELTIERAAPEGGTRVILTVPHGNSGEQKR